MSDTPHTLARPLAQRLIQLPDYRDADGSPPTPEGVIDAAFEALDAGHTHYTDRPGILPLRQKIAADIQSRYAVEINADAVTITCGVTEARFVVVKQLVKEWHFIFALKEWRRIAYPASLIGAEPTGNVNHVAIDLIYATPADPPDEIQRACEQLNEAWIVFDLSIAGSGAFHPAQKWADRTVTIGEFSAIPGWRVGWMAGSKAATKLRAYKQSMTICTPSISQWAALGAEE